MILNLNGLEIIQSGIATFFRMQYDNDFMKRNQLKLKLFKMNNSKQANYLQIGCLTRVNCVAIEYEVLG